MSIAIIVSGSVIGLLSYIALAAYLFGRAGRWCRGKCGYNHYNDYPCGNSAACFWHGARAVLLPLNVAYPFYWLGISCLWLSRLPARAVSAPIGYLAKRAYRRGLEGPPEPPDPRTMPAAPREKLHVEGEYR